VDVSDLNDELLDSRVPTVGDDYTNDCGDSEKAVQNVAVAHTVASTAAQFVRALRPYRQPAARGAVT
jgi:hypothetical protein